MANHIKESLRTAPESNKDPAQKPEQDEKVTPSPKKPKRKIRLNKKSLALYGGGLFSVAVLIAGGVWLYNRHEETKPIGIDQTVQTAQGTVEVKKPKPIKEMVEVVGNNTRLSDRAYQMLWQSRVPKVDNGKDEFSRPEQFRDNMLALLKTLNGEDANNAAALWSRNSLNFSFTSDDNLTNAAIGHDSLIINEYQELVEGIDYSARRAQDIILAGRINSDFKSPWTMAFYAAGLDPAGTYTLVTDKGSNQLDFQVTGIKDFSIRQISRDVAEKEGTQIHAHSASPGHTHDHENEEHDHDHSHETEEEYAAHADNPYYEAHGVTEMSYNKTAQAFASDNTANRVYEVKLKNGMRDAVVVIVERTDGDLYVYGTYFTEGLATDTYASQYADLAKNAPEGEPQNWKQFQDQVDRYFGN